MIRLAVARLWFCSNSFTPRRTRAEDVRVHEWAVGSHALSAGGEMAGVRQFLATHPVWDATVLRCASAPSGGPLSADLFGAWMAEIEEALRRGRFDGIYLSLHGACQAEGDPAADVTILRRVRAIVGHTPIVASFDQRANLSEETALLLDGACAVQSWASAGGEEAAIRALNLLHGTLTGRFRPVGALARVPMLLGDLFLRDALAELCEGPLKSLPSKVLDASVFGGFCWGDSPYAGPSALVWTDRDAGVARETAAHLALALARWRRHPALSLMTPEFALAKLAATKAPPGQILLLDLGDDPFNGGLADTPALLRAVMKEVIAANIAGRVLIGALHDPDAVAEAFTVGPGGVLTRMLGGRSTPLFGPGVAVESTVERVVQDSAIGGFAVLRAGTADILVTSVRPAEISPLFFSKAGIEIADYRLLVVKGGATALVAYEDRVVDVMTCDCPGPTNPDLARLPYHYVPAIRRGEPANPITFGRATPSLAGSPTLMAQRMSDTAVGLGKPGTQQSDYRHEDRRADSEQQRPQPFCA